MTTPRDKLFDAEFLSRLDGLHFMARRISAMSAAGSRRSLSLGDGLEFADHRGYTPGDDLRCIDWPYFARMEKLLLRLFHQHSESDVAILLDCSASMSPDGRSERFDYARRLAAALAYIAIGSGQRVILQPYSDRLHTPFKSGRDRAAVLPLLDRLTELPSAGQTVLASPAAEFIRSSRNVGMVFLISDFQDIDAELEAALNRLVGPHREVTLFQVFSPADRQPVLGGAVELIAAESVKRLRLTVTPELRDAYTRQWIDRQKHIEHICLGRGIPYLAACIDIPFDQLILQTLRQCGVLS